MLVIVNYEFHLGYFKPKENSQFNLNHNVKIILFQDKKFEKENLNLKSFGILAVWYAIDF